MLTSIQIACILAVLSAFGVDMGTINHVHDILVPHATSTPVAPNQPVYFGSVIPTPQPTPVVQSALMDQTDIIVNDDTAYYGQGKDANYRMYSVFVKDKDGNYILNPNDPTATVVFSVDGEVVATRQLNGSTLWQPMINNPVTSPVHKPGILFPYEFQSATSTLTISSQGIEKVIPIAQN